MRFIEFIFSFLFVRNWHTGQLELSRPRVALFGGMFFIIFLGVLIAFFLYTPVEYTRVV